MFKIGKGIYRQNILEFLDNLIFMLSKKLLWLLPIIFIAVAFFCFQNDAAEKISSSGIVTTAGEWFGFSETVDNKYQIVTVIDSTKKVMAVYQIDLASGAIKICAVRKLSYDMQIENLNTKKPLPNEIRALLEAQ